MSKEKDKSLKVRAKKLRPTYYDNPNDVHLLEYFHQLEQAESKLYNVSSCPVWFKHYSSQNDD